MINVTTGIDLSPLQKELFNLSTRPSYIIMSEATKEAICHKYPVYGPLGKTNTYESLCGIPVATCNAVPYGFIDIKD